MEQVVEWIETEGKLLEDEYGRVDLPASTTHLSVTEYVKLYGTKDEIQAVLFFTFTGVLDSYSGFVYQPDGSFPNTFPLNQMSCNKFGTMPQNWYFCASV